MTVRIRRLSSSQVDFDERLAALTALDSALSHDVESTVRTIVDDVRVRGDVAVLDYTARF